MAVVEQSRVRCGCHNSEQSGSRRELTDTAVNLSEMLFIPRVSLLNVRLMGTEDKSIVDDCMAQVVMNRPLCVGQSSARCTTRHESVTVKLFAA